MNPATYKLLEKALKDKHFGMIVDLGCGEGFYGPLLEKHCNYLIGVDHNLGRLSVAKKFSGYDQVFAMDVQEYTPPSETEAVIMLEILEHIPKADGEALLNKLSWIRFMALSTPTKFHRFVWRNGHQSVWAEKELQTYGFQTSIFSYTFPQGLLTKGIFAVREL